MKTPSPQIARNRKSQTQHNRLEGSNASSKSGAPDQRVGSNNIVTAAEQTKRNRNAHTQMLREMTTRNESRVLHNINKMESAQTAAQQIHTNSSSEKITHDRQSLQHAASSASKKAESASPLTQTDAAIKAVSYDDAKTASEKMLKGLQDSSDSNSELNQKKQSMTYDFEEQILGASYFIRQIAKNSPEKSTIMAIKDTPPFSEIFPSSGSSVNKHDALEGHVWLNSIVGTEDKKEGVKSGGRAMLEHAEQVAISQGKNLALAAFDSDAYWTNNGFKKTELEQREEGAEAPYVVMTKILDSGPK